MVITLVNKIAKKPSQKNFRTAFVFIEAGLKYINF